MSLTIAKVQNYISITESMVEYRRNSMEKEERIMKENEAALEMWKATLEKMQEVAATTLNPKGLPEGDK
jgi:hypothetical protein